MMEFIQKEIQGNSLILKLNRPDKYNSFNRPMALELCAALDEAASDTSIRGIMITGNGKAFCAGQDLQEAMDPNGPGLKKILSEGYNPIIRKIRNIEKPVIAAVNGVAAGAGANIALSCDIVVATASASFIQAFSKIGLIPDSGGTFTLPRLIGFQKASALMMLGEKVSASDAEKMGMIYKVYSDEEFYSSSLSLIHQLSSMPTRGLALTKKVLNSSMNNSLDQQLDLEEKLQLEAGETYDYKEGVKAFIEKRNPEFLGK
jgi:2-(1,2-epoxy-1,2-dihydrophenyl)acetyl-CoA isomerase